MPAASIISSRPGSLAPIARLDPRQSKSGIDSCDPFLSGMKTNPCGARQARKGWNLKISKHNPFLIRLIKMLQLKSSTMKSGQRTNALDQFSAT
jgi:hypothetical protein